MAQRSKTTAADSLLSFTYRHRVRYRECDRMGIVYHAHYVDYFEAARTEALRELGLTYRSLEDGGIEMPVIDVAIRFRRPAFYDEILEITTRIAARPPQTRVLFDYEVRRDGESDLVADGRVTLCFRDRRRGRPVPAPDTVVQVFNAALENRGHSSGPGQ